MRHAPHVRRPTPRPSPEHGPAAPPPRGDLRRGRRSHRRDGWAPAGIAPPAVPAVPTALEAREPVRGHANARQTVLARAVIASDTRRIADPPRLKFLSRTEGHSAKIPWIKFGARGSRNLEAFTMVIYFHCGGLHLEPRVG